jgi:hypothetical protein
MDQVQGTSLCKQAQFIIIRNNLDLIFNDVFSENFDNDLVMKEIHVPKAESKNIFQLFSEKDDVKSAGFGYLLKHLMKNLKQLKKSIVFLTKLQSAAWEGDVATALELIEKSTPQELVLNKTK